MYRYFYTEYSNRVNTKWKPFEKEKKHYPCPGCKLHKHPRATYLFNRYVGRGTKAYALYWRMHPTEYKQVCGQDS